MTEKPLCNILGSQVNPRKKTAFIKEMEPARSPIIIFYRVLKNTPSASQKLVKTCSLLSNNTLWAFANQVVANKKRKKFLRRTCKQGPWCCCHCSGSPSALPCAQGTNIMRIKQKLFRCKRICEILVPSTHAFCNCR